MRAKNIIRDTGIKSLHITELDHHENGQDVQVRAKDWDQINFIASSFQFASGIFKHNILISIPNS